MPIVDIRPVVSASNQLPGNAAQVLADSIARALKTEAANVWERLAEISDRNYAENDTTVEVDDLPVFVQVLHADWPEKVALRNEAFALASAVAACLGRSVERVHVEYEPPGRGRIAFGGTLVE